MCNNKLYICKYFMSFIAMIVLLVIIMTLCFLFWILLGTSECLISNKTMAVTKTLFPNQIEAFAIRQIMDFLWN